MSPFPSRASLPRRAISLSLSRCRSFPASAGVWLLATLLLAACSPAKKEAADQKKAGAAAIPVEVQALKRGPIESSLSTFATLEAEQEVKVVARTANRVFELRVEEGDRVAKDDVLVRLDDANQQVAVAKAENSLAKSRREFDRLGALHQQKLISDQVYSDAQYELKQLELALQDARRELDYTTIRAPLAGMVTRRLVKLGDLVSNGQHLFDVIDFESLVARIYVPEKSLASLATNQLARVAVTALGGREFDGRVRRIAPTVDSKSGTVKLTIGFDTIGPLRPGMYVDVELVLSQKQDAILLSKRALVLDGDQRYAFRLAEGRKVERLLVDPVASDRLHVEPATGFREGDLVVVAGQTGLKDGALVRIPGDPDPGATNAPPAAVTAASK
ncbi:MAG: efflux RND transporter periplasmic adaptor subunit [Verrucomicrobiales bacterium]|jgi:membrane fusion protein (multidrug efflux system)|nr:efflux RND transporter periplasmic adaptor subunit [Verrucomicrobiales bacterium]